jgi:LacI family transcriptional regulator
MHLERGLAEGVPEWLERLPADGVIARIENAAITKFLQHRRLPTVDLRGRFAIPGFARFDSDHDAIVRLAVEHFLERGFRHIGFCGFTGLDFSDRRRDAMKRRLARHNLKRQHRDARIRRLKASAGTGQLAQALAETRRHSRLQ